MFIKKALIQDDKKEKTPEIQLHITINKCFFYYRSKFYLIVHSECSFCCSDIIHILRDKKIRKKAFISNPKNHTFKTNNRDNALNDLFNLYFVYELKIIMS